MSVSLATLAALGCLVALAPSARADNLPASARADDLSASARPVDLSASTRANDLAAPARVSVADGVARLALVDGWRDDAGRVTAAIDIALAPGWHTYWRTPGDVGVAPAFDWSGSTNLATVAYHWPKPRVFDTDGYRSLGYADTLVLPVVLTPLDPSRPIGAALEMAFGVCDNVCVQATADLAHRFDPAAGPRAEPDRIRAALARQPRSAREAGVAAVTCGVGPGAGGLELTTEVTFERPPAADQTAVIESAQPELWIGMPVSETRGRVVTSRAPLELGTTMIDRGGLRLTLLDSDRAVDIRGCVAAN